MRSLEDEIRSAYLQRDDVAFEQTLGCLVSDTIRAKIAWIGTQCNEWSMGYNDSGSFWHFQYGPRGAGDMMSGIGTRFDALLGDIHGEVDGDFEASINAFIRHLKGRS